LTKGAEVQQFSTFASGLVIATDPPVGAKLKPQTVVKLFVSKGREQLDVPDVMGKQQDEAVKILNGAGFKAAIVPVFSDTVTSGFVANQSPSIGKASRDSTITLQVSKGPELIPVPDVTGMQRDDAVRTIEALGLKTQVLTPFGGGNKVHAQSPSGGSKVRKGTVVRLLVY
jgi:serine/threonine-protein kinase